MSTATQQQDVEQVTQPGTAAPAENQPASVVKEKKPRGPSKKILAIQDEAYRRGYDRGYNAPREGEKGFVRWLLASFVVGFAVAWRFL